LKCQENGIKKTSIKTGKKNWKQKRNKSNKSKQKNIALPLRLSPPFLIAHVHSSTHIHNSRDTHQDKKKKREKIINQRIKEITLSLHKVVIQELKSMQIAKKKSR
jgi:hypothetical protein